MRISDWSSDVCSSDLIAENYIAGVLLSVRKPFSPGELIAIEDYQDKVVAMTSRTTILMTVDGNQLQLPNALVFKSALLNYTQNPRRRFDLHVGIDPAHATRQAQTLDRKSVGEGQRGTVR